MRTRRSRISVFLLLSLTAVTYARPSVFFGGRTLHGSDYFELHIRRIAFARNALFGSAHFLPAWYPGELFGAPFSANLQSFPWIPTRLLLLLVPEVRIHYALGVLLAALLAALFTYLYCRRAGLSELASVAAGWTFASAGYFASRVFAGHLPLLEAYPALPLLLWLVDRAQYRRRDLIALAGAAACVAVAGHPQIPAYALMAAVLFILFRPATRARWRGIAAIVLGVGATLAAWTPMLMLVRRSTRVLSLDPPANDVTMPVHRLWALIRPGIDGWPLSMDLAGKPVFSGYPSPAWFWDTTVYVGLVPLFVIVWLLVRAVARRRPVAWPWGFLAAMGIAALVFALAPGDLLRRIAPVVIFRSPARLLYLATFAASMALGAGLDAFWKASFLSATGKRIVIASCLLFHFFDLGGFARTFVQTIPWTDYSEPPAFAARMLNEIGSGRVASSDVPMWCLQVCDDAGSFDSILLAGPYRAMLELTGANPRTNQERLNAAAFPVAALQTAGVRFVLTDEPRQDLELVANDDEAKLYRVPNPAPRASFLGGAGSVVYARPASDRIQIESAANAPGSVRVLESWDPGWQAEVDGMKTPVLPANGFAMAVPVNAGRHVVRLTYRTPGRTLGWVLSLISLALLGALIGFAGQES